MSLHRLLSTLRLRTAIAVALGCVGAAPGWVVAQDPLRPVIPAARPAVADSAKPLINPLGAFFRSLALPGWGQAVLDRKVTAGIFLLWEGVALGMTVKTGAEVRFLRATEDSRGIALSDTESSRLRAKKAEREDWIVLLAFNHLFSGLEAYVSAHLWDFPGDLHFRALPGGGRVQPGIGLSFPLGRP